ncbi:MAG: replication initiation protein [Candidatus Thiodiazotropha taylori]|nr:replication initiation protein [Candidatus Thiodiazotropha taylori]MCG8078537.1 replication initiation protein [Candidatus Thiodiazotropha taylori]MCW4226674.1 replication initiation protein [Candidatus Thiodiazotropha endolucinida]MCW4310532.1 replication initiation protein [Candidatus Thiodiazotropha endolucinida]
MKRLDDHLALGLKALKSGEITLLKALSPGPARVCKSNMLNNAHYDKITLVEQRVLLLGIAQLNPFEPVPDEIEITAAAYAEAYGTPRNDVYKAFDHAATRLPDRTLEVFDDVYGPERIHWLKPNTTPETLYPKGGGALYLCFSDEVKTHLTGLSRCFTVYELQKIAPLSSCYSIRLYELFCQWRSIGKLVITLEDFRGRMGLEGEYVRFKHLKYRVIDAAIEELSEKSGLRISWEAKRRSNKVVGLTFNFEEKSLKGSKLARFPNNP